MYICIQKGPLLYRYVQNAFTVYQFLPFLFLSLKAVSDKESKNVIL